VRVVAGLCLLPLGIAVGLVSLRHPTLATRLVPVWSMGLAVFWATRWAVPVFSKYSARAQLCGFDINKKGTPQGEKPIPESLGYVSGTICVIGSVLLQLLLPFASGSEFNAALHSMSFMLFLGFADDVLDIPWRYKLLLPSLGAIPLLVSYTGPTMVFVPEFLGGKGYLDLGNLYLGFLLLLVVFCTNAINILAGVNGLEAGQSFLIAIASIILNLVQLYHAPDSMLLDSYLGNFLSLLVLVPFAASTLGLLVWNWYPSQVFVGDSFTLFSGATLAVGSILGHYHKVLLLFFAPQAINFLYSIPQLLGCVFCPRHRLPRYDTKTGLLHGIKSHMNLINLILLVTGPMQESTLCLVVLFVQAVACSFAFALRYALMPQLFAK